MRTTIDLPPDLHNLARQLAYDSKRSMSEVVAELIRAGLQPSQLTGGRAGETTHRGLPQVSVGRPITVEDVRSLEDE